MGQDRLGYFGVIADDLTFGESALRIIDLLQIRDRELASIDLKELTVTGHLRVGLNVPGLTLSISLIALTLLRLRFCVSSLVGRQ